MPHTNNDFFVIPHPPPRPPKKRKTIIFSRSHCSWTIPILTSFALYKQVILILILISVQYLKNVVFYFEKGLNGQNHPLSDSHHPIKNLSPGKSIPLPRDAIWNTLDKEPSLLTFICLFQVKFNFSSKFNFSIEHIFLSSIMASNTDKSIK